MDFREISCEFVKWLNCLGIFSLADFDVNGDEPRVLLPLI
jgi:hypothetical protein